jgi:tight adherence protein C
MRDQILILGLFLVPAFLLWNSEISWEKTSLNAIKKVGDKTSARMKLAELGLISHIDYENFRYRQLIFSFLLSVLELLFLLIAEVSVIQIFLLMMASICCVIYILEKKLDKEVQKHRKRIESDFPAVVEILTLSLSAGETPLSAMQRVALRTQSPIADEFSTVVSEVAKGKPFSDALDAMGRRVYSITLRRFVDALVIAINRGAPLIEVLHSHAREARDGQRNRVLAAASKAEMSMMIPVVFLILPISILFALWPSLSNLNLFAQG